MAVPVYTVVGLALSVGPSEAWMFRWPLRVVPYFVLPTAVLLAIALAQGLSADHRRRRAAGSGLIILGGAYLAEATRPDLVYAHAASVLLVARADGRHRGGWLAWPRRPARAAPAVLLVGCVAVLVFQVSVFPRNQNLNDYRFPTSVTATSAALVPRYPGTVLEVANNGAVVHSADPAALSSELMFGNMLQAVGVHAVNSYYGMGFKAFTDALCIEFNGSVCPDALRRAFAPATPGGPPLADLLRLETVVVQNDLPGVADVPAPGRLAGRRAHRGGHRAAPRRRRCPIRRVGCPTAPPGTVVADDVAAPRGEEVRIAGGPGGTLTFARLAWPGYTARIDGADVPVRQGPAGLLTVDVPAGAHELALSWSPPAFGVSLASALLGLALALAHAVARAVRRRRAGPRRRRSGRPSRSPSRRADAARPVRVNPGRPATPSPGTLGDLRRASPGHPATTGRYSLFAKRPRVRTRCGTFPGVHDRLRRRPLRTVAVGDGGRVTPRPPPPSLRGREAPRFGSVGHVS